MSSAVVLLASGQLFTTVLLASKKGCQSCNIFNAFSCFVLSLGKILRSQYKNQIIMIYMKAACGNRAKEGDFL